MKRTSHATQASAPNQWRQVAPDMEMAAAGTQPPVVGLGAAPPPDSNDQVRDRSGGDPPRVPSSSEETVSKVTQFLPTGVFAVFTAFASLIAPRGSCDPVAFRLFVALVIFFGIATAIVAWVLHTTPDRNQPLKWSLLRALAATSAFGALALLSDPATSCLFAGPVEGTTAVPVALINAVLSFMPLASGFLVKTFPELVTRPLAKMGDAGGFDKPDLRNSLINFIHKGAVGIPIDLITFYQWLVAQILPGSQAAQACNETSRISLWVAVAIFGALVVPLGFAPSDPDRDLPFWRHVLHVLLGTAAFVIVSIFTPPCTNCLLPPIMSDAVINILARLLPLSVLLVAAVESYFYIPDLKEDSDSTGTEPELAQLIRSTIKSELPKSLEETLPAALKKALREEPSVLIGDEDFSKDKLLA